MKHLLSIALIALVMSGSSMMPPEGHCLPGEVWRCYLSFCSTTLVACPSVWEDGRYIPNTDCHNTETCNWDCQCVQKTKPSPYQEVYD